ncbi:hypothetical protein V5O48_017515 [Marasmius crinis-equi]|uniref:BTB domain-containing protein n=1 Tax=Marasmius crinis-equi TaxID=585013 RepID=A0ABR3ENS2_9AGAR
MAPRRHDVFYTDTIVFNVNDTLFRVPSRYFHEKSTVFGDAFQLSAEFGSEGASDEQPVTLPLPLEASTDDFVNLLKVIWPLTVNQPCPTDLTRGEWISVLKLSTFWQFTETRNLAIAQISKTDLSMADKIVFGRRYRVRQWYLDGLKVLASPSTRVPGLEDLKALQLGEDTALRLLCARDRMPPSCGKFLETFGNDPQEYNGLNCSGCGVAVNKHLRRATCPLVEDLFAEELSGLE